MGRPAKQIDTPNEYLGAASPFNIDEIGTGPKEIEIIDKVVSGNEMELTAFMHEPVTVMIHDSNDPNDVELVCVTVNGTRQFFQRNNPQTVKRYYVERLARAKNTYYSQNLDERLGESMNNMTPRHSLKYPFSVIEDKNPKGGEWLRHILAERV